LARIYGRSTPAQESGARLLAELSRSAVDDVFDEGLHEFLTRMISQNAALGQCDP
jgi:uncharacterized alpha-E superfamily protein